MTALLLASMAWGSPATRVTLLHTNDWQSRLLGAPNRDYTPGTTLDDDSLGGVARLASLIDERRQAASGPVLVLDAGDITMGSLFHFVSRDTGAELELMHRLGYDAVTLGNHDFDFRPDGLADMIHAADRTPPIVATNLLLSDTDPRDDALQALIGTAIVRELVLERDGLSIQILGFLGEDATRVMGQAEPVTSRPAIESAQAAVGDHDLVIALSHSGVEGGPGAWFSEDIDLATQVPELDVVISGHSHTAMTEPALVDGRPVVQAGANTQFLGELVLVRDGERWAVESYTLWPVDDETAGDVAVTAYVELLRQQVEVELGLRFDEVLGHVSEPMGRAAQDPSIGNLVTDAFREAAGADMAMTGNGTLRSDLSPGPLHLSDLFLVTPLGIGTTDDRPGYALMKLTVTGSDLKDLCEFLLVGYQLRGDAYYPRISGGRVLWNPWRVPLDRVVDVELADGPAQLDDGATYTVAMSSYVASFLPEVSSLTAGLLDIQPLSVEVVGDPEIKTWEALAAYARAHPQLPVDTSDRLVETNAGLFRNATWRQWTPVGLAGLLGLVALRLVWRARRRD